MAQPDNFATAVTWHDQRLRKRGIDLWVGSEPTFTQRYSNEGEWTTQALGEDKLRCANALLRELHGVFPGGAVLRSVGRQYPGEEYPRWSIGLYRRRDGRPLWLGPPDAALVEDRVGETVDLDRFSEELQTALGKIGAAVWIVPQRASLERRLVLDWRQNPSPDLTDDRLQRPSIHAQPIPASGLQDELAREGIGLLVITSGIEVGHAVTVVELPSFADVPTFSSVLHAVSVAATRATLDSLVLRGFPPPVDDTVEWATITPDPAVIEINMAPDCSAAQFLERSRAVYRTAEELGLSPYRLYFNGAVADSGGGGQITLGGSTPGSSPFFTQPRLLPRLLRYFNRHPSLSYLFAHDSIGGSGQSVRPDERGNDAFRELGLTLELLDREESPTPEILWRSLAPFLTDPSGNAHRAELNIEKLWNPFLTGRGQLGLVEFRAFRMQHTPERAAALVCLLRSIAAMLCEMEFSQTLTDWNGVLHERYALPFYLEQDLHDVLRDLDRNGFGLPPPIPEFLLRDEFRDLAEARFDGYTLRLRRGLEFWPLVGDTSSQEQGASRLVDSSTQRLELSLWPTPGCEDDFQGCRVWVDGIELPLRDEIENGLQFKVFGLRYRSFIPWLGLHPTLTATPTVCVCIRHPAAEYLDELMWHNWRPGGGPYDGLPADLADARARRAERLKIRRLVEETPTRVVNAPCGSLTAWTLDLRWLDARAHPVDS